MGKGRRPLDNQGKSLLLGREGGEKDFNYHPEGNLKERRGKK